MSSFGDLMEVEQKSYDLTRPRRVFYIPILSNHISYISQLIVKLPMETVDHSSAKPMGTTYADIQRAYIDAVDHLEMLMAPVVDYYTNSLKEPPCRYQEQDETEFHYAKHRFGWLVRVLERSDMLKEKFITIHMVDDKADLLTEAEMNAIRENWVSPTTGEKTYGKPGDSEAGPRPDMVENPAEQPTTLSALTEAKGGGPPSNRERLLAEEADQPDTETPVEETAQLQSE